MSILSTCPLQLTHLQRFLYRRDLTSALWAMVSITVIDFVGASSGASLAAVSKKLAEIPAGSTVLTFRYDKGERYLSVPGLFPEPERTN